ncbi:phenylalanine--tRNA ligase subunit alpha [Methanomassiliicoccus luminyensis]|uniref:phenylalanine--tRNA ligase subunit alpha n=1 Tax=Methanomassiliicoccus luminyensis TaxID=1080712 RepID=UPI000368930D|nr:phenylalanine--tRNA ligase subunit alpha [Methanomassiliicoccus luminyensis]
MNVSEILEGLSANEAKLLLALDSLHGKGTPEQVFAAGGFEQPVEVMNAASWLQSKGLVQISEMARKVYSLKDRSVLDKGLPERRALNFLADCSGEVEMKDLSRAVAKEEASIALGWLRKKGLATVKKDDDRTVITITDKGRGMLLDQMDDERTLKALAEEDLPEDKLDKATIAALKSRQDMVNEKLVVSRTITVTGLGKEIIGMGIEVKDEVAQLIPELIQTGKWRDVTIRKYDVRTFAPAIYPGKKHPLTRIADEVREIFVDMGFQEIDEEYVQPAFWNMDALFIPQDHPAREMQDTFFLKNPAKIAPEDEDLVGKVCSMHECGGKTGSQGWGYKWCREESERALLRTHTTVNTIRHLWKHPEPPVKVFSLSKVFRKEAIDATHLPEFTQIEGIIMEKDASFDMLCGVIREFYRRMGFEDIRFRPGYFPYTEPSMEIEVRFKDTWMELGGSGIFRPEVTAPFGIEYPVLAWGFGFERLAMLRWNLKDLRDLYISDVDMLRQSPLL